MCLTRLQACSKEFALLRDALPTLEGGRAAALMSHRLALFAARSTSTSHPTPTCTTTVAWLYIVLVHTFKLARQFVWQPVHSHGMLCMHRLAHKTKSGHFINESLTLMLIESIHGIVVGLRSGSEAVWAGGATSKASKSDVIDKLYLSPEGATGQNTFTSARKPPRALPLALAKC